MRKRLDEIEDRVYIRVSNCAEPEELARVKEILWRRVGKVFDYGFGTEKDPTAAWFEVRPRERVRELGVVEVLNKYDLLDRIDDCCPISRGYGSVHARQLDLFQVG